MIKQTLHYGELRIPYQIAFRGKRAVAIRVHPDGQVHVDAPVGTGLQEVKNAVLKRAHWICVHLERIDGRMANALPREYVSGESHFYLGKRYVLKVRSAGRTSPSVKLVRGQIEIMSEKVDRSTIRSMLWDWYKTRAREVFERRLQTMTNDVSWLNKTPSWKLRIMKKQWGSCSPAGVLLLNPHLIKAPVACIDYVMLHELCHLRFHDHSKNYYRLLAKHMPGWVKVKTRLDGMAELLLNV